MKSKSSPPADRNRHIPNFSVEIAGDASAAEAQQGTLAEELKDGIGENFDLASELERIPQKLFFRIGEVAELLQLKAYVLRFWETEFPMVAPKKSTTGQRVYRRRDVELLFLIKHLLYIERFSIEGARKRIRELKREGELKPGIVARKREGAAPKSPREKREVRTVIKELRALVKKPVTDFFRF